MAIITFWNNNTGKIGQTYSSVAIATQMAIENNYKILLMSTSESDRVALTSFGTEQRVKTLKMLTQTTSSMELESGIEGLAKLVTANRLNPENVPNYTKVILKDRLEVISQPKNKSGLDYSKLYSSCIDILNVANRYYDIILVDLNNGIKDETTREILKMSNMIILNMEQKLSEIEKVSEILKNKEIFKLEKLLLLINNYDRKSKYTAKNMTRELGRTKNMLTVPYCNLYSEAVQEGTTAEFFLNLKANSLVRSRRKNSILYRWTNKNSKFHNI